MDPQRLLGRLCRLVFVPLICGPVESTHYGQHNSGKGIMSIENDSVMYEDDEYGVVE